MSVLFRRFRMAIAKWSALAVMTAVITVGSNAHAATITDPLGSASTAAEPPGSKSPSETARISAQREAYVRTIRNLYDAFARRDVAAVWGALAPNVNWTEAEGSPYGGTYAGPTAVLHNVLMKLETEWEGFSAAPKEFIADGDRVVVLGEYSGVYRKTGKRFSAPFAHVWKIENGKVGVFRQYTDTAVVQRALR